MATAATATATILGLDAGSFPAWLSLVAGVIAGSIALRNLLHDRRDRRRSQASKVACWWGMHTEISYIGGKPSRHRTPGGLVRNASELPVHDVVVHFHRGDDPPLTEELGMLPPASEPIRMYADGVKPQELYTVTMDFRDAAGRLWRREQDGRLTERRR